MNRLRRQADLAVKRHFKYRRDLAAAAWRFRRALASDIGSMLCLVGLHAWRNVYFKSDRQVALRLFIAKVGTSKCRQCRRCGRLKKAK